MRSGSIVARARCRSDESADASPDRRRRCGQLRRCPAKLPRACVGIGVWWGQSCHARALGSGGEPPRDFFEGSPPLSADT